MQDTIEILSGTLLFNGFTNSEINRLLVLLSPSTRHYQTCETLLMAGFENHHIGIVLNGRIEAKKTSKAGEYTAFSHMGQGSVFGDVLSGGNSKSPVTVSALVPCTVLLFSYPALLAQQKESALRLRLITNLVAVISDKYFALNHRVDLLLTQGLRRRISRYLLHMSKGTANITFQIPFTRAQLANYLGCERTALCRELSRMVKDGLIETYRTSFRLLAPQKLEALL